MSEGVFETCKSNRNIEQLVLKLALSCMKGNIIVDCLYDRQKPRRIMFSGKTLDSWMTRFSKKIMSPENALVLVLYEFLAHMNIADVA